MEKVSASQRERRRRLGSGVRASHAGGVRRGFPAKTSTPASSSETPTRRAGEDAREPDPSRCACPASQRRPRGPDMRYKHMSEAEGVGTRGS